MKEKASLRFKLFKNFKEVHKNKSQTHSSQQNKENRVDDNCLFQSFYFHKVVDTLIALRLPSFTKKVVLRIKQKK